MATGSQCEDPGFASVQRENPEMEAAWPEVIDPLLADGRQEPAIRFIQ